MKREWKKEKQGVYIHNANPNFQISCYHDYISISLWMPQALASLISQ